MNLKGQETHEGNGSLKFKVRNDTKIEVLCNLSSQRVLEYFQLCVTLQITCAYVWKRSLHLRGSEAQDLELWLCYLILKKSENMVSRNSTSMA